jgi:hypothetical protein
MFFNSVDLNQETEVDALSQFINSKEFEDDVDMCFGKQISKEKEEDN